MNLYNKIYWSWWIFLALLIALFGYSAFANEFSIIKPITGKHYNDRNFKGREWNENYWDSLGLGYRHKTGLGASITYVHENSINKPSWYIHTEYMYDVNKWLSIGGASGVRTGYNKPIKYSGALQLETNLNENHGLLWQITDRVSVINYKYRF